MNFRFIDFKIFDLPELPQWPQRAEGDNGRRVLLIYTAEPEAEATPLKDFLAKIVAAVGLDLQRDLCLLRLDAGESCRLTGLRPAVEADTVLVFGIAPPRLGLHFRAVRYQPVRQGGITYFFADDLNLIFQERQRGEKERSAALWQGLQVLFPGPA